MLKNLSKISAIFWKPFSGMFLEWAGFNFEHVAEQHLDYDATPF